MPDPMSIVQQRIGWRPTVRDALNEHLPEADAQRINRDIDAIVDADVSRADQTLWEWRSLIDAYAPRPPLEYLVDGLLIEGSLNMFFGAPGCLKSMLVADLAMCVAGGLPWLTPLPNRSDVSSFTTTKSPIAWVDCDNGTRRTDERMEAIGRAHQLAEDAPVFYLSLPNPAINAGDEASVAKLANDMRLLEIKLIVMDNLGTIKGNANENSDEMVPVMANLRRLADESRAAICLIHHQRKLSGMAARDGDNIRGHSSIESSLDLGLKVDRESPDSQFVTVKAVKVRGAGVRPFQAMFAYDWKEDTQDLEQARFYGAPLVDDSNPQAIKATILEIVDDMPGLKKGDLVNRVREVHESASVNMIRRWIDELTSAGKITEQAGARNSKSYIMPD